MESDSGGGGSYTSKESYESYDTPESNEMTKRFFAMRSAYRASGVIGNFVLFVIAGLLSYLLIMTVINGISVEKVATITVAKVFQNEQLLLSTKGEAYIVSSLYVQSESGREFVKKNDVVQLVKANGSLDLYTSRVAFDKIEEGYQPSWGTYVIIFVLVMCCLICLLRILAGPEPDNFID
ncbi:MAG: hypothetical protein PHE89_05065 [Alphaproteobacteria bacterium]|nr:hypothetical protein [Alphaproteobacteria bacterium]